MTRFSPWASVSKIPILIEVYRRAAEGGLSLDSRIELTEFDRNPANFLNEFGPGLKLSVRDLATMMIIYSDSSATDMLLRNVGAEQVTATMHKLGLTSIQVNRTIEDILWDFLGIEDKDTLKKKPYRERNKVWVTGYGAASETSPAAIEYYTGDRDVTRASDMARLLEMIVRSEVLDKQACRDILRLLYRQRLNFALPRLLPPGTPVGHKTGNLGTVANDVGVVSLPDGSHLIVVVFTKLVPFAGDEKIPHVFDSSRLIARITRHAYDYFVHGRMTLQDVGLADVWPAAVAPFSADTDAEFRAELGATGKRFGREFALAAKNLGNGKAIYWREDEDFLIAGLVGVPVLMQTFLEIADGKIALGDRWILTESDRQTFGGGFLRELEPGLNPSVNDLINLVGVRSDWAAIDLLLNRLGTAVVNDTLADIGLRNTRIDRTLEQVLWDFVVAADKKTIRNRPFADRYAFIQQQLADQRNRINRFDPQSLINSNLDRTTARDQLLLLEVLGDGKFVDYSESEAVLETYYQRPESLVSNGRMLTIGSSFAGVAHQLVLVKDNNDNNIAVAVLSRPSMSDVLTDQDLENWDRIFLPIRPC